jgi:hypothetical protein
MEAEFYRATSKIEMEKLAFTIGTYLEVTLAFSELCAILMSFCAPHGL